MPLSYAALFGGRAGRGLESARHIMASYTTSEIRGGLKVLLDGDPYTVIENEFVKPGKGQAFNRIKVRNLKTGRTIERTFRSGESLEAADVVDTEMQYLYHDATSGISWCRRASSSTPPASRRWARTRSGSRTAWCAS